MYTVLHKYSTVKKSEVKTNQIKLTVVSLPDSTEHDKIIRLNEINENSQTMQCLVNPPT